MPGGRSAPGENASLGVVPVGLLMLDGPWGEPILLRAAHAFEGHARTPRLAPPLGD